MKTSFKYIMLAFVAVSAAATLQSCSDDDSTYTAGPQSEGAYLYADFSSKTYLPADEQTFTIQVGRTTTSGSQTISLNCEGEEFTAPTSVTFKDGESTVSVPVSFNLEIGSSATAVFTIPTSESSVYGDDTLSVSVSRDYTWESAGTAEFVDGFYSGLTATVAVEKAKEGDHLYKFVSPMTTLFRQNGEATLPGALDFQFTMDDEGNVSIDEGQYPLESGTSLIGYYMYYVPSSYPSYCNISNDGGDIVINSLWTDGTSLYTGYWEFVWTEGYPLQ